MRSPTRTSSRWFSGNRVALRSLGVEPSPLDPRLYCGHPCPGSLRRLAPASHQPPDDACVRKVVAALRCDEQATKPAISPGRHYEVASVQPLSLLRATTAYTEPS